MRPWQSPGTYARVVLVMVAVAVVVVVVVRLREELPLGTQK